MMEHEDCQQLLGSLSEYIDGALSQEVCAHIEQHIKDCHNCRIVMDTLRKTVYLYQTSAQSTEFPEDVRQRLYRCLNLEEFLEKRAE